MDPQGLWGVGANAGGTAEVGAGIGIAAQANSGVGVFGGGSAGVNVGGYTASGGFMNGFTGYTNQFAVGLTAGLGVGLFGTNATSASALLGPFDTWTLNLPAVSFQFATDGTTNVGSVSLGKSWGFSFSRYSVTTTTAACFSK